MRTASATLCDRIAANAQVGTNEVPSLIVYVRQRYWDNRDIYDDGGSLIDKNQEWYQLTSKAISCEVQENTDSFSSSFSVTFENANGMLAPDNYNDKWPGLQEEEQLTYARQFFSNNQLRIYLGYGYDEVLPFIHGWVTQVQMNAEEGTIVVECNTSYKHLIHQTIKEKELKAPDGNLYDVLKFFFDAAGVTLNGSKVYVPGTNGEEEWTIKGAKGTQGQAYDEIIRDLIDTTFHYIRPNFDGSCTLMEIPHYTRQDPADVIFDDGINLTALDYIITDQDVSCAATVKAGNSSASFMSTFLYNDVLLKRYKEEMLEVAWADTYMKKYAVACAYLRLSYDKFRTLNVGVVGDPRLQIWDRVGIRERTSSQTWIWHIKGLQTTISADNGFFQVLDLAVNYDVKLTHPPLPSDISPIQVTVPTIRLQVWDFSREDGDVMNIYKDGVKIKSNYEIKNDPINIDIDLNYGDNVITFEGVSCGTLATLSGRLKVMDTSNNILFNSGSLPDLEMARTNCNSSGIYSKRPVKTWIVARVYPPTP